MFAVSGHRPQENLFLLNGIEYTGASEINNTPGGASGQLLGVDAVREFNVVTDTYGAEYGKRPGAQVSIVTASGTNQLHGSLYEFLRNSALDARNFFDQASIPPFQRNEFGGALGGPLKKNKLFLFGNYEGFRQHLGLSDVTLVPDNAARNGYLPGASGKPQIVGVSPASAALLSLWPVQNGPDLGAGIGEAFSHPLQRIREDFGTTRLDYNPSDKDTLFAVYTIDDSADNTPTANPLSGVIETLREQVTSVQEQHVFSPSILNTARVGFSRAAYFFTGTTPVNTAGWVAGDPIGAVVIGGGTALNGASQITLAGTNAGSNLSAMRNLFTYDDHVAITHGIHQLEAGVWLERIQANDNLAQYQYGQASFGSLASFLQGTVSTFTVIPAPTPLGWRSIEAAGFVQDAIRLTPHFELRLGFRFESTDGWNEAHGRGSNYVFDSSGVIQTNPRIASSVFTVNRAKFLPEPRVAFAWDPFGASKTVIRAGFGIYRALLDNLDYRLDQTAPFNSTDTLKNVSLTSLHILPGSALPAGGLVSPSGIQPDAYTPTILSYTFKIEQQIAPQTSLSVGYVGSHGYHEMLSLDANEPFPTICPSAPCPSTLAPGTIYYPSGAKLANPNLANTTSWFSEGVSSYNGLEVDVNHHFDHGFQLRGVYTFAKSLDDGTAWNSSVAANAPGFVMYPLDPKLDWGRSTTDVRHLAVINGTYELPFGVSKRYLGGWSGWRSQLVTGWSISAIETLQSGLPFTPQLGFNPSNNSDSRNPVRPSWNAGFNGNVILGNPSEYFNPNAFLVP
ncbi:MAG: carboxypeptidase regulatory-like domain-containing protein, partial [Acidobacteriaceae bacterium]|nr:carboxypeptidase regulatory-like domain-containing protein [Acidobacteriaceae bacterium]